MADVYDVEQAFVAVIAAAIYPSGPSAPSAIIGPNGAANCRVYPGWPLPQTIDADMIAGTPPGSAPVVNVSVHALSGSERNSTRYPQYWYPQTTVPCSMTAALIGLTITIGGTVTPGHYITIHIGEYPYSYAASATDTLESVAAALCALIAVNWPATVSGTAIALGSVTGKIVIRTAAPGTAVRELDRTEQRFSVTIWAPNNALRVATARIIRPTIAALDFFPMPDGYVAEIKYESTVDLDRNGKQNVSCRDIHYWAEYPTTQTMISYPITTFSTGIEADTVATKIKPLPLASFNPTITVID